MIEPRCARLAWCLCQAVAAIALMAPGLRVQAADGDPVAAARVLSGVDPVRARAVLQPLRQQAIAGDDLTTRLAVDELDCRLLSDDDLGAAVQVADAALGAASAAGTSDPGRIAAMQRLRACRAGVVIDLGRTAEGEAELETVLRETADPSMRIVHALALLERGRYRSRRGDLIQAQHDLIEACRDLRESSLWQDDELCRIQLANHYKRMGDYDEALRLLDPLRAAARARGARFDESIYLYGIGDVHAAREAWVEAVQSFKETSAVAQAAHADATVAYAEHGMANALRRLKRPAEAVEPLQRALAWLDVPDRDPVQLARSHTLMAAVLTDLDRAGEAARFLPLAEVVVRRAGNNILLAEWHGVNAHVMARLGRWQAAYESLRARSDLDRSLEQQRAEEQQIRLRLAFNRESDQRELQAMRARSEQSLALQQAQAAALALFTVLLAVAAVFGWRKLRQARRLQLLASSDELTGLPNRRAMLAYADQALEAARLARIPLSLLMIDVDHFKRVNDELGHAAGDTVLRRLATLLPGELRGDDRVGRIGGEEFLAVLPNATLEQAVAVSQRMRDRLATAPLVLEGRPRPVTISIGVAEARPTDDADALIERADRALYAAKTSGRDRVVEAAAA